MTWRASFCTWMKQLRQTLSRCAMVLLLNLMQRLISVQGIKYIFLFWQHHKVTGERRQWCYRYFNSNFSFLYRYSKKCSIPASTFFEKALHSSDRTMTFYDLSIPYLDDQIDHSSHFSNGGRQTTNRKKRYAMPMVIKNTESNKVCTCNKYKIKIEQNYSYLYICFMNTNAYTGFAEWK